MQQLPKRSNSKVDKRVNLINERIASNNDALFERLLVQMKRNKSECIQREKRIDHIRQKTDMTSQQLEVLESKLVELIHKQRAEIIEFIDSKHRIKETKFKKLNARITELSTECQSFQENVLAFKM